MILERGITIKVDNVYIYGEDIEKIKISEQLDPISSEIPIGICDFTLKRRIEIENLFDFGKFFEVYFNGNLKAYSRVYSIDSTDANHLKIQSEDLFGVLEDEMYYGNIVFPKGETNNFPKTGDILKDVFNTAKVNYEIEESLKDIRLNGELLEVTCREALMQICFAIGAVAYCSGQNYITVKKPNNIVTQVLDKNRIKENPKFTTNIMTKIVNLTLGYSRAWDDESNITPIFSNKDVSDISKGEIRTFYHKTPMGDYQMKSTNREDGNEINITDGNHFKFVEKKPNKVSVQFIDAYFYAPTSNEYFSFDVNPEDMTATVRVIKEDNFFFDVKIPDAIEIDAKWYKVTSIGQGIPFSVNELTLPPTITTIEENAFDGVSVTDLCIPKNVIEIKNNAFKNAELTRVYYGGNQSDWNKINFNIGNESIKNYDSIYYDSDKAKISRRPFSLVGFAYEETRKQTETRINPNAINYPYSQQASIEHATLVTYDYGKDGNNTEKTGNLTEVLDRVYNELTKTEQIECDIVEGRTVQEGDFVRYGQTIYGSNVYGGQMASTITYDKPVNLGDVVGIEVNEYGYREKRIISQEYELQGNILVKRCILR